MGEVRFTNYHYRQAKMIIQRTIKNRFLITLELEYLQLKPDQANRVHNISDVEMKLKSELSNTVLIVQ